MRAFFEISDKKRWCPPYTPVTVALLHAACIMDRYLRGRVELARLRARLLAVGIGVSYVNRFTAPANEESQSGDIYTTPTSYCNTKYKT